MIEEIVKHGNIERALFNFSRKVCKSGILKELRNRESYMKPSEKRHRKKMILKKFGQVER